MMPYAQIEKILKHAAGMNDRCQQVVIQMFDEPTMHPRFLDIIECQNALGLAWDGWFIPTNGWGLARMDDTGWRRLAAAGKPELQVTFYGLNGVHDAFAGRDGAYSDLVTTVRKAADHGIGWTAGIIAWPGNIKDLPYIRKTVQTLASGCTGTGWFLPAWQGRGQDPGLRCTAADLTTLKLPPAHFKSEKDHVADILSDDALGSRTAVEAMCAFMSMEIQPDMTVVYGGACDTAPPPELLPDLTIGTLTDDGFDPLIETYRNHPPELFRRLGETTWKTLAQNCGDPTEEGVYLINDLVANKWVANYFQR